MRKFLSTLTALAATGITVLTLASPASAAPFKTPAYQGAHVFHVGATWTMAYTYDCANLTNASRQSFIATIHQPGTSQNDIGPNEFGGNGSGNSSFVGAGLVTIKVWTPCKYTLTVH